MRTFAILFNPVTIKQLKQFWPMARILPDNWFMALTKGIAGPKIINLGKMYSSQGKGIRGYFMVYPLIAETLANAAHAAKRLGTEILGLCGFDSVSMDRFNLIAKKLRIPLTSGDVYTAWAVFEQVYRIAKIKKINLKNTTLAIIGAAGSTGTLCAKKFAEYAKTVVICGQDKNKLANLKTAMLQLNPALEVIIEADPASAVRKADIVINADNSLSPAFDLEDLKPESMVIDASFAKNIVNRASRRSDITVIESGLIKLPFTTKIGLNLGLPGDMIYACMAEAMLLALEEKLVDYSLGADTNPDKLEEIADLAARHSFEVYIP